LTSRETYPAARIVAPKVHAHFFRHLDAARRRGLTPVAALPDANVIERLINATFWASLRREEGYIPKISIAYLPPEHDTRRLLFEHSLPLEPGALAKVAPIVERAGIHLGVWHQDGELRVWGTTHVIPTFCFVVEVVEPGLLVIKHHRGEQSGKYVNVAVIEGDQIKVIDEHASSLPDCPELVTSLLGFDSPASWIDSVNVLVQLAVSMRAHGRGGSLLVVPAGTDSWRRSIVDPIVYSIAPPFRELTVLMRESGDGRQAHLWQEALRETVDAIAGLTAVDGATVITDAYELLAFGAKIARKRGSTPVEQVTITEPIEGGVPVTMTSAELGGTRHLSAAQFVHDQRDAIALVASQDRRFTVFAWSPCEERVHAHRVEALLL
jgi:sensor domain DACNV-containing protein